MKTLGAAAAREYSFERCVEIGKAVNAQLVSIGSALDHCHVPGRQNHDEIGDDVCVIGAGIHNEPVGTLEVSMESCTNAVSGCSENIAFPFGRGFDLTAFDINM